MSLDTFHFIHYLFSPHFPLQIIFHKENPGIDYEFYVPVEKKEIERERLMERERETPRERHREREPARAPLRSMSIADFPSFHVQYIAKSRQSLKSRSQDSFFPNYSRKHLCSPCPWRMIDVFMD